MRFIHIARFYFLDALTDVGRSFVWFALAIINPLMVLMYYYGAHSSGGFTFQSYTFPEMTAYYIGAVIVTSLLVVHVEEVIAFHDIALGNLSGHLLRPIPYFVTRFLSELPFRIIQGGFGIIVFVVAAIFYPQIVFGMSLETICMGIIGSLFGYGISFFFKMTAGFCTFWLTDYRGMEQLVDVFFLMSAGLIVPLSSLPFALGNIFVYLPLSGVVYYPLQLFLGKYSWDQALLIYLLQAVWMVFFYFTAKILWHKGLKIYDPILQ